MFINAQNCSRLLQCTEATFRFVNLLTINLSGGREGRREGMQGNYHEEERIWFLCSVFVGVFLTRTEMSLTICHRVESCNI